MPIGGATGGGATGTSGDATGGDDEDAGGNMMLNGMNVVNEIRTAINGIDDAGKNAVGAPTPETPTPPETPPPKTPEPGALEFDAGVLGVGVPGGGVPGVGVPGVGVPGAGVPVGAFIEVTERKKKTMLRSNLGRATQTRQKNAEKGFINIPKFNLFPLSNSANKENPFKKEKAL